MEKSFQMPFSVASFFRKKLRDVNKISIGKRLLIYYNSDLKE